MLKRMKLRIQDMKTIAQLIPEADKQARMMDEEMPGAEHFLLAALALPDGTAQRIFERIGLEPEQFQTAAKKQYSDVTEPDENVSAAEQEPKTSRWMPHNSKPSGKELMKRLQVLKKKDKDRPLLGAHVVAVVAGMEHGVAVDALKAVGVDQNALLAAVKEELG